MSTAETALETPEAKIQWIVSSDDGRIRVGIQQENGGQKWVFKMARERGEIQFSKIEKTGDNIFRITFSDGEITTYEINLAEKNCRTISKELTEAAKISRSGLRRLLLIAAGIFIGYHWKDFRCNADFHPDTRPKRDRGASLYANR